MIDQKALTQYLKDSFAIDWDGYHDAAHWSRVALWGKRVADILPQLRGSLFNVSEKQFAQLSDAIRWHSDGLRSNDVTIQSCWDADRLDLARVGIYPDAHFLSHTGSVHIEAASEMARAWTDSFKQRPGSKSSA